MADSHAWPRARDFAARPLLWRLPLVVLVVGGLALVVAIDALLRRDVEREAARHAEQVQSLLGARLNDRAGHLHALSLALAALDERIERPRHFAALAGELHGAIPEVVSVVLVDTLGQVRDRLLRQSAGTSLAPEKRDPASLERAVAVATAVRLRRLTITPTITLHDSASGVMLYEPIEREGRLLGLVGVGIAHDRLFAQALASLLRGRFANRVRDGDGDVIAGAQSWPDRPQRVVTRPVLLPDGRPWLIDIAVPGFEPFLPRLLTGLAGLTLIFLVVAMVVREANRGHRLAEHSLQLELLSRDLLDANVSLEERAAQVAEANRAKSRFLANVSHELRTPVNAIVGYNELAMEGMYGALPAGLQAAHERIRLAARHLLALVDDVLDLSRIEAGRMALDPEQVELRAVLEAVISIVAPTAAAKGLHVDLVAARDLPRITTDVRHLRQIMLNLVTNAVKFTERGVVTLVARRDPDDPEGHVLLVVEDTGIGIAPADHDRIFEEFEQVHADARGDSLRRGTGLGLSIVRKLARLLGGDVTVESALGRGARFIARLPIVLPAASGAPATGAPTPAPSPPRYRTPLPVPKRRDSPSADRAVARTREPGDAPADDRAAPREVLETRGTHDATPDAARDAARDVARDGRDAGTLPTPRTQAQDTRLGVDAPDASD